MMNKHIILTSVLLLFSCESKAPIEFFKEDIIIEVIDSRVRVTGLYFFRNTTKVRKRITFYYPFSIDSHHSYPDTIVMRYPYEENSTGISFTMSIDAMATDSFSIIYIQAVRHSQFTYITTTTKEWERPIENAHFTIIMSDSLSATINYAPYKHEKIDNRHYFYILQKTFYPEEDLRIEWFRTP